MSLITWMNRLMGREPPAASGRTDFLEALAAEDYVTVFAILKTECDKGNADAMATLAALYRSGRGVEKDEAEAVLWYRQAAVRGHVGAQAMLGEALASGSGAPVNHEEAAYWLYRSAKGGCDEAIEWLADLVLQAPEVIGKHFQWNDVSELMKARGQRQMLGTSAA